MKYFAPVLAALMAFLAVDAHALGNPSFEEIKDGKAVGWRLSKGYFRAEKGVGHNGSGGVVWEAGEPSQAQSSCVAEIAVERGVAYLFSCLVHAENFRKALGDELIHGKIIPGLSRAVSPCVYNLSLFVILRLFHGIYDILR